jgi:protein-disulfide isomerase
VKTLIAYRYGLARMPDLTSAPIPPVTDGDHIRGDAGDPGIVVMYADFTCPRCAVKALEMRDAGESVVFRHFALKTRNARSVALAQAAEAAALQGAFWAFHDSLFEDQGRNDDPHLWARCEQLGLDIGRFEADRRCDPVAERVSRQLRDGMRAGVTGTPALLRPTVD